MVAPVRRASFAASLLVLTGSGLLAAAAASSQSGVTARSDSGPYSVMLLTNVASPGNIFVGLISAVKAFKYTCKFTDGGLCAGAGGANVPVTFTMPLGTFSSCGAALAAYTAHTMGQHPAFGGQKIYFDTTPIPRGLLTPPSTSVSYFIDNASKWCAAGAPAPTTTAAAPAPATTTAPPASPTTTSSTGTPATGSLILQQRATLLNALATATVQDAKAKLDPLLAKLLTPRLAAILRDVEGSPTALAVALLSLVEGNGKNRAAYPMLRAVAPILLRMEVNAQSATDPSEVASIRLAEVRLAMFAANADKGPS